MDTKQQHYEDQEECVSKKTPRVPLIQRKVGWLGNKQKKKSSKNPTKNQTDPDYPRITLPPSPTSSSESEGDVIEYEASSPSQPRTSGLRASKSLDLNLNQINRALGSKYLTHKSI